MILQIPEDLVHVSFFFIDIVGLSNPEMSTNTQTTKIKILNKTVNECKAFSSTPMDEKLVLPTGDGMAVGFLHNLESPIQLAIEFHEKIRQYNSDKDDIDKIFVRIGCHSGNVFVVKDLLGNKNFWGPGIILARRVMDIGDSGHILMTSSMAESLLELSDDYKKIIHSIHDYQIKHGQDLFLYSVYNDTFGNSKKPKKRLPSTPRDDYTKIQKNIRYTNVEFNLNLKDLSKNLVESTQVYEFENISDEPLFEVKIGMSTNSEKSFDEINVTVHDNDNHPLTTKEIIVDSQFRKEFIVRLNDPIFKGDQNNRYTVNYELEESQRFYENMFLINAARLAIQFKFNLDEDIKEPHLYLISHKDREKKLVDLDSSSRVDMKNQLRWIISTGAYKKDIIRMEW